MSGVRRDYDGDPLTRRMSDAHRADADGRGASAVASRAGAIYSDLRIDDPGSMPIGATNTASYVLGVGQVDSPTGAASYHHGNQIGTLRATTDDPPSGPATVTGRIVYTAFGEQVHADGTIGTRYQYAGSWGYEAGLYEFTIPETAPDGESPFTGVVPDVLPAPFLHVGHRWYDAALGRFLQRDPIGIIGALNTYSYVDSEPLTWIGPDGRADIQNDRIQRPDGSVVIHYYKVGFFCGTVYLGSKEVVPATAAQGRPSSGGEEDAEACIRQHGKALGDVVGTGQEEINKNRDVTVKEIIKGAGKGIGGKKILGKPSV